MMPINSQTERKNPKLAPEVVNNMLFGPGVIAATHKKPSIEKNKLGSIKFGYSTLGNLR
jgi:hypothetical protein